MCGIVLIIRQRPGGRGAVRLEDRLDGKDQISEGKDQINNYAEALRARGPDQFSVRNVRAFYAINVLLPSMPMWTRG